MPELVPLWEQPSHPGRLLVVKGSQPYKTAAFSLISLPAGAFFAKINSATPVNRPTYTSVASGKDSHLELNSDLVYCNHSCNPSLIFDMTRFEVRVSDTRPLSIGDSLTWFYPASEWEMAQGFTCECGEGDKCLGFITGSSKIDHSVLERYWVNDHIRQLVEEQMQGYEATGDIDGCGPKRLP
ncbi:putative galactose-proton symport [Hirsutella rhossiliensis]